MQLYNCKVRLGSNGAPSLYNEVHKIGVTVPEIIVLRHVHGGASHDDIISVDNAAVTDIAPSGDIPRSDEQERTRLAALYAPALRKLGTSISLLFGAAGALPRTTDGVPDGVVKVDEPVERVKRGRKPAQSDGNAALADLE
jgi:hypothetical protein